MLQIKNISKSYQTGDFTQTALRDVSLAFRESEFVAVLGPSGSGKTTFLNVVGGLDQYDSGDLLVNGTSTKEFRDRDWDAYRNGSIGFVFQSYNLISHLNILDNVEMGMTLSGVPSAEKREKAKSVLDRVGLSEHLHKKPNQLSGGQMQRVAIARALANDPDIILADEPTGALDSQTSEQIMDLIREIAKDKLVIMVTHNPDIAEHYASRIIRFSDGQVVSDSNPFEEEAQASSYKPQKTSMGFPTALKLSGKNIATKKWRTGLTAFASSIGIIGIALVLSLSNGFNKQIDSFEKGTLANFPITIGQTAVDMGAAMGLSSDKTEKRESYPDAKEIYPHASERKSTVHTNVLTQEYLDYLKNVDPTLLDGVSYTRSVNLNLLQSNGQAVSAVDTGGLHFSTYPHKPDGSSGEYLQEYYDLLAGAYPSTPTDLVLALDERNQLDTTVLKALGLDADAQSISFDQVVGKEFKLIMNDDYYKQTDGRFTIRATQPELSEMYAGPNAMTLRICGVVRAQKDSSITPLSAGVCYSDELVSSFIENAVQSQIVKAQQAAGYNVFTGLPFTAVTGGLSGMMAGMHGSSSPSPTGLSGMIAAQSKEEALTALGAVSIPTSISLYPVNFDAKTAILSYLDGWNSGLAEADQIAYTDMAATMTEVSGSIMSAITIVLIAFAAISLFVSLIMIGIITYISVMERTKEIGVLRALGARKKDISRVFNAETFLIGMCSGLLGILIAWLLTFPVNSILYKMTELPNVAQLNPLHAVILVTISVILTMIGGFIPAKMAAKKDPVVALRTE